MSKSEAIISVIVIAFVAVMGVRVWIGYRTEQRDHAHEPSADTDMSWQQEDAVAAPTTRTPTDDVVKTQIDIALREQEASKPEEPEAEEPAEEPVVEDPAPVYAISERVPLPPELQRVLVNACELYDLPVSLMLGLIEVESQFDANADNGQCYGYCQLNRSFFPSDLTPTENIQNGTDYLSRLLDKYGTVSAALTAYNVGHDDGSRSYANSVLAAANRWDEELFG